MMTQWQPTLFEIEEVTEAQIELFPAVWSATEGLTSPKVTTRMESLDVLAKLNAHHVSPLVAALLATRLDDPDLGVRDRVVELIGEALMPDESGRSSTREVRQYLFYALRQMRRRTIFALLQVAAANRGRQDHIARILNACPYAGGTLADILCDRKAPLVIRKWAVHFLGRVGFLEAIPTLERLLTRLQARASGQRKMPFAPVGQPEEATLIPEIKGALQLLRAS